ncbi:intraflagellar transport protein 172 homolog isoform X2 [Trichoplusia ni]|uniref:Intraflagellar transport protein 172 homolog isoform X2 n=1 Tax=Trichoplusia ni TaxID=7111 RepID=A0A7E5VU60_TRINI|nr:intraflagellar transport protein 172 homolog isoform X2 [Trichoplusia ni]
MRLKYAKTLLEAQDCESPIADICWSPNNVKLAVATCDRQVLLFDRDGNRRDKFVTKPADSAAGKKSYVITSISFSENSEMIGVAQSDNMVFVYRVGADWSGKKVICNKFPLTGAPMSLLPAENGFYTGTSDGKIRSLDCKINKSSSMWTGGACCVALARGGEGTLASGHVDGTLYLNGRLLLRYTLPPTALVLLPPYLIVGSCDGRVAVYEAQRGALLRSLEPSLPPDRRDIISAAPSPSGQTVAFGVFDGCLVGEMKESGSVELAMLNIPNFYAARALAWSGDGTKLAIASQTGAVIQLEAVLRRWVWRDTVAVQHVSARQLVLTRLANDALPLTVTTKHAPDIFNVRFIGNDWYAVCRTSSTLILCDIARGLTSEIPWSGSGERVYAAVGGACLLHRAGELSVVEYGLDKVLHTVRTERVNPHVLSVRINEGAASGNELSDRKHLAYLLDRQTIAVVDLATGIQLGQWWHEARVDWLELNESGQLLLLRDTRRRLALLRLHTGDKEIIASGVSFVQWIENSDAVVAQTPTHLLVWYSAWDSGSVEMAECGGAVAVEVISRRVVLDGGLLPYLQLDEHRLAFNNALRSGDLDGCAKYLDGVGNNADVAPLWRQLAERALADENVQLAAKCYREVDDEARTFYLEKTVELAAAEGDGDVTVGLNNAIVRARLAIFAGDLATAEECYVRRAGRPDLAVDMYKQFNKWTDAIALAERTDRASVATMKQQHMDYLTSTGRLGEAGAVLAASGDIQGAVKLWLRGGRSRRAAALLLQHPHLLRDTDLIEAVHTQLIQEEWWETAGEISERRGDTRAAVEYYAKGNNYARAVQLAREACPSEVTALEGRWGAYLVSARQAGAAVPHLIEAGQSRAALDAALAAHHYRKALQILQAIDDKDSIKEQCERLGDHFISTREWETAERVLTSCGMAERCVKAYNAAGRVADGLRLAAGHLTEEQTREIYMPLAQQLRMDGQLRKAEQIYIGLGEPDEAISMYKEASQYEAMLRLVAVHRGSLLEATRRHVAQALHASGDLRTAENYYIQAGDWKSAIQMYRSAGQWEGAERVARAHAPSGVQQQVALQWAGALGGAPAARLLAARGLAALGARWAIQAQRWDIAMELCSLGGGMTRSEVARAEAASLADEHPDEAEAAFLRASAPDHAVRMWLQHGKHQRALTLAEQHAPHMVEEVLVEGARAAAERGDLPQFEALMIRANRPREVVQHYKDLELWDEAARVSREYLPDSSGGSGAGGEGVPGEVPALLQRAAAHADAAEWWEAVRLLGAASAAAAAAAAPRLAERAALRAARLARDHLHDARRRAAADMLAERFAAIGQTDIGEQLRAALSEGYATEDEAPAIHKSASSTEYEAAEEAEASGAETEESSSAALERLARAGHWQRCLAHAAARAPHYALRYAAHMFKAHPRMEGIDIESEEAPEVLSQVLEVLRQYLSSGEPGIDSLTGSDAPLAKAVCSEILVRVSTAPKAFAALKDASGVMVIAGAEDRALQAITLLMALHVPQIAGKAARALPRYTDIIVADVAYYACGMAVRAEGASGAREAFVLLNRCLDLAEAADDDSAHLLDYTDFECTDWSRTPLLLESGCVRGGALEDAREWVLAVSMDQAVEQTLPVDSRGMYASSVADSEACCVITGYPLGSRLVTFTNGRCANREWWSRCAGAARAGGAAAALLRVLDAWCGPADVHHG